MQHTLGPWRIFGDWPTYFLQSQNITDRANLWADICTLNMANGCGMTDARLISAAPDLLAALIEMTDHFNFRENEWNGPRFDQARDAIAKATNLTEG